MFFVVTVQQAHCERLEVGTSILFFNSFIVLVMWCDRRGYVCWASLPNFPTGTSEITKIVDSWHLLVFCKYWAPSKKGRTLDNYKLLRRKISRYRRTMISIHKFQSNCQSETQLQANTQVSKSKKNAKWVEDACPKDTKHTIYTFVHLNFFFLTFYFILLDVQP